MREEKRILYILYVHMMQIVYSFANGNVEFVIECLFFAQIDN